MSAKIIMTVDEMEKNHDAWINLRKTGIGGSEVASILGMSPWGTPFSVWALKTGMMEPEEITNDYVYFGKKMEAVIAEAFSERTGIKVRKQGMLRCVQYPFALADVDRVCIGENAFLECKNVSSWRKDEFEDDKLPDNYYLQMQWYCFVGGYDYGYLAALVGGNTLVIKRVDRNEEDIQMMLKAAEDFWNNYVMTKKLPSVDGTEKCTEALIKIFPGKAGEITEHIELESEYETLCTDIKNLSSEMNKIKKVVEEKKNRLRMRLENAQWATTPTYNISYKVYESDYIDKDNQKVLKEKYPNIYKEFAKTVTARKLLVNISRARTKEK